MKFLKPHEYQYKAINAFNKLEVVIKSKIPNARIEHIGSSSIDHAISKGDLDIFVGVNKIDFESSLESLINLGFKIKADTFRSTELCMLECFDFDFDVGIQLVDLSSKHINFLKFRDKLKHDSKLLEEYNHLKLSCKDLSPEAYRERKSKFIHQVLSLDSKE